MAGNLLATTAKKSCRPGGNPQPRQGGFIFIRGLASDGSMKTKKGLEEKPPKPLIFHGTGGRNRTDTRSPPLDFESSASTSFTTPAQMYFYILPIELFPVKEKARSLFRPNTTPKYILRDYL